MNPMKVVGVVAAGVAVAALIGGGVWWWRQHKDKPMREPKMGPTPGKPPRMPSEDEDDPDEDAVSTLEDEDDRLGHTRPRGHFLNPDDLDPDFLAILDEKFPDGWPATDEVIDKLVQDDVVVVAVQSETTGNYSSTTRELISAKVLSVENTVVRARILGEVRHAEHHGAHAGHGFRPGDLIEVPRSKILVAARDAGPKRSGYGSLGKAAETLKPSDVTDQVYSVNPGTPYDLEIPYRTKELEWHVDRDMVTVVHVGEKGPLEQILFAEDSMRGYVTVRALDRDPKLGVVFMARWEFDLDA